ncbi:MAG TPA: hypothetical protein VHE54_18195 [Puia sp.]|nr:hypothetical protein [Puia sp.]
MSLHSYYQGQVGACGLEIRRLQNKLNGLAFLRVMLFAGFAWSVDVLIHGFSTGVLLIALGTAAAFLFCVNVYLRWKEQRRLQERLKFVSENELALLNGSPSGFPDGSSWLDSANYLDDLDIFGPRSLFHHLNRTTTARGAAVLADRLRQPFLTAGAIQRQQEAIRVLALQTAHRQLLTATGLVTREDALRSGSSAGWEGISGESLRAWLDTPARLNKRVWPWLVIGLLALVNLYGLYRLFDDGNYTLIVAGIIVSRLFTAAWSAYVNGQHRLIGHQHALFEQYAGILAVFNQTTTSGSALLQEVQQKTGNAHRAIRRLARLSSYFDQRLNLLVNLILNTFFCYDLLCMIALERWKAANHADLPGWIDTVGTVETLNSFATFAYNHPEYCYPIPAGAEDPATGTAGREGPGLFIEATGLAHPMIPAARRVANDLSIGRSQRLILVTGSNMSGKTTFLRTVGVNLLMAECGLPVCAASFHFTPMHLLTSLRITDSLQEQTSYFMAELNKLQMIIRRLSAGEPALVLIDEILRGTNSEDKTHGSEQFIRRLVRQRCLSFFATHDLTLGQLEQEMPGAISNYCFESVIEAGQLHFDYRLRRGVARNRNASFLMRKMDII